MIKVGMNVRVVEGTRKSKHVGKTGKVVGSRMVKPNGIWYELFKVESDNLTFELTAKSLVSTDVAVGLDKLEVPKLYQIQIPDRVPPYVSPLIELKVAKAIAMRLIEDGIKFQLMKLTTF